MPGSTYSSAFLGPHQLGPWTISGGPDPDFGDGERDLPHGLLTDPSLLTCFRRRFPYRVEAGYDEMVRLLDYVWDCPEDGTANVVGYRCGRWGHPRAAALRS